MSLDTKTALQASLDGLTLESELGGGGMSRVYTALDERLGRKVVVKVLRPELAASISAERFEREIRLAASLQHPNIVPLLLAGDANGLPYFTMPFVEGESLRARLAAGPLSITEVVGVLRDVVRALSYAHARGVVHRDIKPDNVLLSNGTAVVADFGIAKALSASRTESSSATLTQHGIAIGTPAYMSPEQAAGEGNVDHRTDIYALGCMAYEMLAGRTPFHGRALATTLAAQIVEPPRPLTHWRTDIPAPLADLVTSCLAKNVEARPQSASDIGDVLDGLSSGRVSTKPLSFSGDSRPSSRLMQYGLGVVAVGTVVAVVSATTLLRKGREGLPISAATVDSGMVLVPMGTYVIGSSSGPAESRPPHAVRLQAFGVDRHEVTIGDYRRFVEAGLARATWEPNAPSQLPVTGVLLAEADSFCTWKYADGGRLPTEEEWEAAARGMGQRKYPWGNSWDSAAANVASPDGRPVAGGSFPRGRTPEGVEDMIGNVWEWTSSRFIPYAGVAEDSAGLFVIRGGAYNSLVEVATAYYRGRARAVSARSHLAATGFRCAMSATQPNESTQPGRR